MMTAVDYKGITIKEKDGGERYQMRVQGFGRPAWRRPAGQRMIAEGSDGTEVTGPEG